MRKGVCGLHSKRGAPHLFPTYRQGFAQPRIAADRFAREIGGFLHGSLQHAFGRLFPQFTPALAAAEC